MDKYDVRFPVEPEVLDGRKFQLVVNTEEPEKMAWVYLQRGNQGKIVGRLQDDRDKSKHGMIVFFPEFDRERLAHGHYAVVMVKHLKEKFGFVELGKFGLLEDRDGVKQVHSVYQNEHPVYMDDDLDAAKLQHFRKMRELFELGLQSRTVGSAT